jgi:iron complex outermembrane receptor protein
MRTILVSILLGVSSVAVAQEANSTTADMYELSLEELMNIPIHSASKKQETTFDAPLSSYTLTRSEIEKSGASTIMEALRLVPGLIVREQSNGVYDIHIRGLDNILRSSVGFTKNNLFTLVMIDSRPAFNYNLGGTFWEALPVDIADVERIEIVRGPSAPLFGPNAVTGVVNIITRRVQSDKAQVTANVVVASPQSLVANAYVGKKISQKLNAAVSFNHQDRSRFDERFYQTATGEYTSGPAFINNFASKFPDESQAMKKTGANIYLGYNPADRTQIDFSVGLQENTTLRNLLSSFGTTLNTTSSNSIYANLAARVGDFNVRTSYINGSDNIQMGAIPSSYDFNVTDINAEYTIRIGKKVSVVPGINFQNAVFSDEDYRFEAGAGFLNGTRQAISTVSGFIRSDINVSDKWRVIAALRADRFSAPDDLYLAYELASTYKINDNNLIRMAVTQSNSGAFVGYNKLNLISPNSFHLGGGAYVDQVQIGNESLDLLTVKMVELGYRGRLTSNFHIDVDVFRQEISNLTTTIIRGFTEYPPSLSSDFLVEFGNVPTTATQYGATIGFNFVPSTDWQIKPFITLQTTRTEDLPSSDFDPQLSTNQPGMGFPAVTYSNSRHAYTPAAYGGFYINYKPHDKLNVNLNSYLMSNQTWYTEGGVEVDGGSTVLVNAKISYAVTRALNVYLNGRNLLEREKPQFLGGDHLGALLGGGISLDLK